MKLIIIGTTFFLNLCAVSAQADNETNLLIIPKGDTRGGVVFFVDECLTRGLTNSISLVEFRKWATNTIQLYQKRESTLAAAGSKFKRYSTVLDQDVPKSIQHIQDHTPCCRNDELRWDDEDLENRAAEEAAKLLEISKDEVKKGWRTIGPDHTPPEIGFVRSQDGVIQAITIEWYLYGITMGPQSYIARQHWYDRKLADGIYLWCRYK